MLQKPRCEAIERVLPALLVQCVPLLGLERTVLEEETTPSFDRLECQRHKRLLVVRRWRVLRERIREAPGRIEFSVLAVGVERVAVRRLHFNAIPPSLANLKFGARHSETSRPPPPAQLGWVEEGRENSIGTRRQHPIEAQVCLHEGRLYRGSSSWYAALLVQEPRRRCPDFRPC